MDVDTRLQNLGNVDISELQFQPPNGFDPAYTNSVYSHGMNGGTNIHAHPQAQFASNGNQYFDVATQPQQRQQQQRQHAQSTQTPKKRTRSRVTLRNSRTESVRFEEIGAPIDPNLNIDQTAASGSQSRRVQPNRQQPAQIPHAQQQQQQHSQYQNSFSTPSPTIQKHNASAPQSPTATRQPRASAHNQTQTPQSIPSSVVVAAAAAAAATASQRRQNPSSVVNPVETPVSAMAQSLPNTAPSSSKQTIADQLTTFNPPSTFDFVPQPPNLEEWRERFFNIAEPILLTSEQYHTYFPHVDNIYSHRSTQKYKKKPFVSHYWDCRLKGRPTGQPMPKSKKNNPNSQGTGEDGDDADEPKEKKKRKRKTRERDLCDVKIKVTEYFGRDELEALGRLGISEDDDGSNTVRRQLTFVLEDGTTATTTSGGVGSGNNEGNVSFGVLEPLKRFPDGHPGAEGRRWYMVQRVNGTGKDGEIIEGMDLDHKHTLEESDRIKKNSVQRWLLAQDKEKKKQVQRSKTPASTSNESPLTRYPSTSSVLSNFAASGDAKATVKAHSNPSANGLIFFASAYCPFAQRVWIALEFKKIPYQFVEVTPNDKKDGKFDIPSLLEVCPQGKVPCIRLGNFGIWESSVMLEYLEDLILKPSLLPWQDPALRAHSRLWTDHINRRILPFFYALLLLPMGQAEHDLERTNFDRNTVEQNATKREVLLNSLQSGITELVNASHAVGPFFLGDQISFVDVNFAPWIIRLSRVLVFYRDFPRPEVGTRWAQWVNAIEADEHVKKTVSAEKSYHNLYSPLKQDTYDGSAIPHAMRRFEEMEFARNIVRTVGFGLGGDCLGSLGAASQPDDDQS